MQSKLSKKLIVLTIITTMSTPAFAESLFKANISENAYPIQPKSLFSSVRAKSIGDIVVIVIDQDIQSSDQVKLSVKKSSSTDDNFSRVLNETLPSKLLKLLPHSRIPNVDGFGGGTQTSNQTTLSRSSTLNDTVATQVVQVLPNGNLLVQGKKSAINSGEKVDLLVSGIVDPRLLDGTGKINSTLVANLQIAIVGKGTASRSDSEGTVPKIFRYLY